VPISSEQESQFSDTIYIDSADWTKDKPLTVLNLAHKALQLSSDSTKIGVDNSKAIEDIVKQAKRRIRLLKGADLRGRASADAALCFALSGVQCNDLYDSIVDIAAMELPRFGPRASCKPNHILQMAEKFAASGIMGDKARKLYDISSCVLEQKGSPQKIIDKLSDANFGFFSVMPLVWLWRYSTRQSKVVPVEYQKEYQIDWHDLFKDPTRPLVCDLGSGMGVSLLGLATLSKDSTGDDNRSLERTLVVDWTSCNFLGSELNPTLAGFASGMAKRRGLSDRLQYVTIPSENLLRCIRETYPGLVKLVMVQFPTPYRLKAESRTDTSFGNQQLPSKECNGFMVTTYLLQQIACSLKESQGYLMLTSKSEDVAVSMRKDAEDDTSLFCVDMPNPVLDASDIDGRESWRTKRMLEQGGTRAIGSGWSKDAFVPRIGISETEVSCLLHKIPIHRCLLESR